MSMSKPIYPAGTFSVSPDTEFDTIYPLPSLRQGHDLQRQIFERGPSLKNILEKDSLY